MAAATTSPPPCSPRTRPTVDAARDYAQYIPMRVIADMLGFPPEDGPRFREFIENTLEGVNLPPEERMARTR